MKLLRHALPIAVLLSAGCSLPEQAATPSASWLAPLEPVPTGRQLAWHALERCAFAHFGIDTFTGAEWGTGKESEALFNPTDFDARQWAQSLKEAGFSGLILTAKHHDGFCLWPSKYTEHSVAKSPWKNGRGDVVREVSDACREFGLKFGVYLSPWDRHEPSYGDSPRYDEHYLAQLRELLTNYGPIFEVWWDGACGEGPNGKKQVYDWPRYIQVVRELQPEAVIFSDVGPDVRWVGNEHGFAGETCWGMISPAGFVPGIGAPPNEDLNLGRIDGTHWIPAECDVSIRPGWFYHASQDSQVKTLSELLEIWYASVGRGANLLLNVPPDRRGRFHENDVARLKEFDAALKAIFAHDLARGRRIVKTPTSLEVTLAGGVELNHVVLREDLALGQRVESFRVEGFAGGTWKELARATTVGNRRVLRFPTTRVERVRVKIERARAAPMIASLELYDAPAPFRVDPRVWSPADLLPPIHFIRRPDPGLVFSSFAGERTNLADLATATPADYGNATGFDLALAHRTENFALQFQGNLDVPADGGWRFSTTSDDGSRLWIDDQLVVDNDGLHGMQKKSGEIGLVAGWHKLRVAYFNASGARGLEVRWQGPGVPEQPIPADRLGL